MSSNYEKKIEFLKTLVLYNIMSVTFKGIILYSLLVYLFNFKKTVPSVLICLYVLTFEIKNKNIVGNTNSTRWKNQIQQPNNNIISRFYQ